MHIVSKPPAIQVLMDSHIEGKTVHMTYSCYTTLVGKVCTHYCMLLLQEIPFVSNPPPDLET